MKKKLKNKKRFKGHHSGHIRASAGKSIATDGWAHFWTKSALNALAERPAERIFVNVGMSRGSSDLRSVPFLLMFCRCRAICASLAPRTAKPRKNIRLELENRRLRRPGRLPDGWWDQKRHVGWPVRASRGAMGQPDRASRSQIEPSRAPKLRWLLAQDERDPKIARPHWTISF